MEEGLVEKGDGIVYLNKDCLREKFFMAYSFGVPTLVMLKP